MDCQTAEYFISALVPFKKLKILTLSSLILFSEEIKAEGCEFFCFLTPLELPSVSVPTLPKSSLVLSKTSGLVGPLLDF